MDRLESIRRAYAAQVQAAAGLPPGLLVEALAKVPRERFLGPGPWQLIKPMEGLGYQPTPDADAAHLYQDVLVAIDPARQLNNGHPSSICRWLAQLEVKPGDRVMHLGCGTGYYTAILAEAVGPSGDVLGVEIDAELAARAREALAPWPQVTVVHGDGADTRGERDALFVNAGATHPLPAWLDALRPGGRLLLPLTTPLPFGENLGGGMVLLARREAAGFSASFVSPVGIYHCLGARDPALEPLLRQLLGGPRGGEVRSLRRDAHERRGSCVLHGGHFCLSEEPVPGTSAV